MLDGVKVFQSLIGELKTYSKEIDGIQFSEFQSLIGELKTVFLLLSPESQDEFQSLIGELKTFNKKKRNLKTILVSIPHRRAKNYKQMKLYYFKNPSFNPS